MENKSVAIIMKGLSGSGKSTYCEGLITQGFIVFSRDTTREQNPLMKEKHIIVLEDQFIRDNIGNNIVIDNTHMSKKSLEILKQKINSYGYSEIIVANMGLKFSSTEEYLKTSLERNSKREGIKRVPDSVIYQQYLQEYDIDGPVVICDIDGTIADLTHRLHFIKQEKKDHDSFYKNVSGDLPIHQTIAVVQALKKQGYTVVMMSGRRNQTCQDTIEWLNKYEVPFHFLLMRSGWDHRQDYEVKEELYERCLKNNNILLAIDDRKQIVDLWRSLGIFVMDVRQTDTIF